jgi:predicted amidohydrolase
MNSLLLTGGRVIDPASRFDAIADVLIQGKNFRRRPKAYRAPRH